MDAPTTVGTPPHSRRTPWPAAIAIASAALLGASTAAHAGEVAAASSGPGQLVVLTQDPDTGLLAEARGTDGSWEGWTRLSGDRLAPGTAITAVATPSGTIHAFYRGADRRLHRRTRTAGGWSAPAVFGDLAIDAGPSATRRGSFIEIVARAAGSGRLARWSWRPGQTRVARATTPLVGRSGADPAVAWTGRALDVAYLPSGPARRRVAVHRLGKSTVATPYVGDVEGSPALAAATDGRSWVVVRRPGGEVSKRARALSGAATGAWQTLGTPPGAAPGGSPAALLMRPRTGAPAALTTVVRGEDPRALLVHQHATGWQRVALPAGPVTATGTFADPLAGRPADPAARPTPQPTPEPTPEPTPTPEPPGPRPSLDGPEPQPAGTIRYFGRTSPADGWDPWFLPVNTPLANRRQILRNVWRLELFANANPQYNGALATSWFTGGMVYRQLYTIDPDSAARHPSWVMRDGNGTPLYADDGPENGPRALMAGNIFNPRYRAWAIDHAPAGGTDQGGLLQTLRAGNFRGLWLDNVNPELLGAGLVTQSGAAVGPVAGTGIDAYAPAGSTTAADGAASGCDALPAPVPGKGLFIDDACWAGAITTFVQELHTAMPAGKELLSNVPWYRTQRELTTYSFIDQPTPAFAPPPNAPPGPGALAGGLWTDHGNGITAASTYMNIEGAFWANARGSGPGRGPTASERTRLAGRSTEPYSLDMIFRYVDALHRRGKGFVADNWMDRARLNVSAVDASDDPLLRVQEFNLAGYLLATDGRDGIGDYNPKDDLWPRITGSGGTTLYGMDVGVAAVRPPNPPTQSGATPIRGSMADPGTIPGDDPGPGPTGRGVADIGAEGHRLWGRRFVRTDGQEVYVLFSEPASSQQTPLSGETLTYQLPDPALQCTNMTRASQAPYARWDAAARRASLRPAAALFLLCGRP